MRYNKLGSTGLFVSELCLGTMTFGGSGPFQAMGHVQQADADAMLDCAFGAGINMVDTADTYSGGESERILGQALKNLGKARDEVVIATKVFGYMGDGPNAQGSSRAHILDAAKASLKRLGTDYIDLYQLHGFDVTSVIVGARRVDQLNDNLGSVDISFTPEELQTLDSVSHLPAEYPGWMFGMWGQARVEQLAQTRNAHAA